MTAQISDTIRVGRRALRIQGVRGGPLFDPKALGWTLTSMSTACWRGYVATYAVRRESLVLTRLSCRHARSSLTMEKPVFVVDVEAPSRTVERHDVFEGITHLGPEGCPITLRGLPQRYFLELTGGHFRLGVATLELAYTSTRVADGAAATIGPWTIRPRIAGGPDEVYTAELPALGGVSGVWDRKGLFAPAALYRKLDVPTAFTGTLLGCRDFIQSLYVHMGFHPAWKFAHVEELSFEAGRLTHHEDVSEKLAEVRKILGPTRGKPPKGALPAELEAWVERTFSLRY